MVWHLLLLKSGPKALRTALGAQWAPPPSKGARRRDVECPELQVNLIILNLLLKYIFGTRQRLVKRDQF